MQVRYYCHGCFRNKEITVPDREKDEGVTHWIEKVRKAIGEDHQINSPACHEGECDLMFAVGEKDEPLGDASTSKPISPELMSRKAKESKN